MSRIEHELIQAGVKERIRTFPLRRRASLAAQRQADIELAGQTDQKLLATISFLIPAIAFAGFNPFGHAVVQFMMVWQR